MRDPNIGVCSPPDHYHNFERLPVRVCIIIRVLALVPASAGTENRVDP